MLQAIDRETLAQTTPETQRQIFERIFGAPMSGRERDVRLTLFIDGQSRRTLEATVPGDETMMTIEAGPFLEELTDTLLPGIVDQLKTAIDDKGRLARSLIESRGIGVEFDPTRLGLQVKIPVDLRRRVHLRVRDLAPTIGLSDALRPAKASAFANIRASQEYVHQATSGTDPGRQPLIVGFNGAINIRNWVASWEAFYEEDDPDENLQRGDLTLSHDDVERSWRYSFGDVTPPTRGFQAAPPLAGFSLAKAFEIQPYRTTRTNTRRSFELRRPSTVDVIINGQRARRLDLPAGPFSLSNFPLATGANDVRLRITDDLGQVEIIEFPFFFESELLAVRESEFAYSIGFPYQTVRGERDYDTEQPTFSMFHRHGLNETTTVGAGLQGDDRQQMASLEASLGTKLGNFRLDLGASRHSAIGEGLRASLAYRRADFRANNPNRRTWSLSAEYITPDFNALGSDSTSNQTAFALAARFTQRMPWDGVLGLGASHRFNRGDNDDSYTTHLFASKSVSPTVTANLQLQHDLDSAGATESRALFSFSVAFPTADQHAIYTRDTSAGSHRLDWRYSPPEPIGGLAAALSAERAPDNHILTGDFVYTGNRGRVTLEHDQELRRDDDGTTDRRSKIRLDGAVVFADGYFGLSRTVNNSFALLVPHPTIGGQTVNVNPTRNSTKSRIDALGPAVLPDLTAYRLEPVKLEAPDLPEGYELGETVMHVLPSHLSGTLIPVGTDATVFAIGRLVDSSGAALALQSGLVRSLDDPGFEPEVTFSNRKGRIAVAGLRPGRYVLLLVADETAAVQFVIPPDAIGRHDIGNLRIPWTPPRKK